MGYRAKNEWDLDALEDDDLFEQLKAARAAGDSEQLKLAIGILAWRREGNVFARIRLKMGDMEEAEDLTQIVLLDAMRAKFDGEHIGEFGSMLNVITSRRIADFYSKNSLDTDPMVEEGSGDDDLWGQELSVGDFVDHSNSLAVLEQALEELDDRHRMVVELSVKGGPAKEVADDVNAVFVDVEIAMTDSNVHQIMKRFRDFLNPLLKAAT
ncbi:MAG: sigma-70 family RNA polymerase sigma factor [Solirubrobacterales bacterium]|nr:sigma-70 family RNA polymerase sigma factor [Solirubrobacterales bacterium]